MFDDAEIPEVDTSGWNQFLHSLRSAELRRTAPLDGVLLSAGCAGTWYFEWIDEMLRGRIDEHLGVEAYSPEPEGLAHNVTWIAESIGVGITQADESVDMVFAGQAIEHFWVDEVVSFLTESWRVLRPEGRLVLDSPNRRVTEAIEWWQPEHTIEFTADEAMELLEIAGFTCTSIRGLWSCYDHATHTFLPLEPDFSNDSWKQRIVDGVSRPDDAFVWWIECLKSDRRPDVDRLRRRVAQIAHHVLPRTRGRCLLQSGVSGYVDDRFVVTSDAALGCLRFGPYVPLGVGRYEAVFEVSSDVDLVADQPALMVDVVCGYAADETLASTVLVGADLEPGWRRVVLPFEISSQRFAAQFRAFAHQPGARLNVAVTLRFDDAEVDLRVDPSPVDSTGAGDDGAGE